MKKVLFLADSDSAHTRKWAESICREGWTVGIYSLRKTDGSWAKSHPNLIIFGQDEARSETLPATVSGKWIYYKHIPQVKRTIREFVPDIVHAHYATSYGLLGRKSGFHPFILSAWGSDILDFPANNFLRKYLLKKNLRSADLLLATSATLAEATEKIVPGKKVDITPFGIDTSRFRNTGKDRGERIVIGTIKSFEKVYRIDRLINGFYKLRQKHPVLPLHLLLVGEGSLRKDMEALVQKLSLSAYVTFTGKVEYEKINEYHNQIDIFVNLPQYESFGVSVLEAMACEKPVIVSDTGGLREIVEDGATGFRIEGDNLPALENALEKLVRDPHLRVEMGKRGREKVLKEYSLQKSVETMLHLYNSLLGK